MHSPEEYGTAAVGGAVGGVLATAQGMSVMSIDWNHTIEYGINLLIGTIIVTMVKLLADYAGAAIKKKLNRRPKGHAPRR